MTKKVAAPYLTWPIMIMGLAAFVALGVAFLMATIAVLLVLCGYSKFNPELFTISKAFEAFTFVYFCVVLIALAYSWDKFLRNVGAQPLEVDMVNVRQRLCYIFYPLAFVAAVLLLFFLAQVAMVAFGVIAWLLIGIVVYVCFME